MEDNNIQEATQNKNSCKNPRRRTIIYMFTAIAVCVAIGLMLTYIALRLKTDQLLFFAGHFYASAIILIFVLINDALSTCTPKRTIMPYIAILIELLSIMPIAGVLSLIPKYGIGVIIIYLLLLSPLFATLIIGIILGIVTLCGGIKKHGVAGFICGITAIIMPFAILGTQIILLIMGTA